MSSRFEDVEKAEPIQIFELVRACREDPFPNKVDLSIGAYRTNEGKPWVLPVVKKAELSIVNDENTNHEYLSQVGLPEFTKLAQKILLGEDSVPPKEGRTVSVQSVSGTGGLFIGAQLLCKNAKFKIAYHSSPTWGNHSSVFLRAGFEQIRTYRYWNAKEKKLDFSNMIEDLSNAPEDSVIILHACAHNPTGIDPTRDQWKEIADVMERKRLFPLFDCAYQGFASGDLANDSYSVRYFVSRGFELMCVQSFAKNFGLYCQRVGNVTFVVKDSKVVPNIQSQMTAIVREVYSNPPAHGARIVARVLSDPELFAEWNDNIKTMSQRIIQMRQALRNKLEELKTPGDWSHITTQIGMFSYLGLTPKQVEHLTKDFHIYLMKSSRISLCGLNTNNVDYVAKAINEIVNKYSD